MTHQSSGKVKYDPTGRTDFKKWWVIVQVDTGLIKYYQHIFYKLYFKKLQTAAWSGHISLVRGEEPVNKDAWKQFDNRLSTFSYEYDGEFSTNGKHFWLKCWSNDFIAIRQSLGLKPIPNIPFHISIGSINE